MPYYKARFIKQNVFMNNKAEECTFVLDKIAK